MKSESRPAARRSNRGDKRRQPRSLAQTLAMLGLAMGAVVPMAGCSGDQSADSAQPNEAAGSAAEGEQKAANPCAVKKKKTGPCAVGG
ncbi:hypothetical protein [Panacagrimonas sp.]|uniref:hypothetical protein n=1 Tax=Panacagrimonas sp. TaxID=2480088 RepID=UPI003B5178A4